MHQNCTGKTESKADSWLTKVEIKNYFIRMCEDIKQIRCFKGYEYMNGIQHKYVVFYHIAKRNQFKIKYQFSLNKRLHIYAV